MTRSVALKSYPGPPVEKRCSWSADLLDFESWRNTETQGTVSTANKFFLLTLPMSDDHQTLDIFESKNYRMLGKWTKSRIFVFEIILLVILFRFFLPICFMLFLLLLSQFIIHIQEKNHNNLSYAEISKLSRGSKTEIFNQFCLSAFLQIDFTTWHRWNYKP